MPSGPGIRPSPPLCGRRCLRLSRTDLPGKFSTSPRQVVDCPERGAVLSRPTAGRRSGSGTVGRVENVTVGARGSRLAQGMVKELITHLSGCPVVRFKARSVMTDGDQDRKTLVRDLGGGAGGVFTTQLEQELLAGRVDIAVHSLKDLPTTPPDGLVLAVTPPRADPLDALCGST